jgi:hypothetical protein
MDRIFYHWSPRERRSQITRLGLVPGSWSRDRLWKPPYVCLAPTVIDGWLLSGRLAWDHTKPTEWDLWEVDVSEQSGYERLRYDDTGRVKEIRVYERIYKRNVWFVGTRNVR